MSFVASYIAVWLLVAFLTLVAIALVREVTELKRSFRGVSRTSQLRPGSRAPHFSAINARSGETIDSKDMFKVLTLVAFVTPHCGTCRKLLESFRSTLSERTLSVMTICKGAEKDCKGLLDRVSPEVAFLVDPGGEVSELFGISGYPSAIVINSNRRVLAYGYPRSGSDCAELVADAIAKMEQVTKRRDTEIAQGVAR